MLTRILHRTFTLTCITLLPFLSNPSQKLLKYKYIIRAQSCAPLKVLSTRDFFALAVGRRKTTLFTKIPYLSKNTRTYTLHSLYRISHASFKYVIYLGSPYEKYISRKKRLNFDTATTKPQLSNILHRKQMHYFAQNLSDSLQIKTFLQNMIPLLLQLMLQKTFL